MDKDNYTSLLKDLVENYSNTEDINDLSGVLDIIEHIVIDNNISLYDLKDLKNEENLIVQTLLEERDFLHDFKLIVRECNYTNTYKMAWAKALVEISIELSSKISPFEIVEITLEDIAKKYLKYYWNQTIFFDMIQGANPGQATIITITKNLIDIYFNHVQTKLPIVYEKADEVLEGILIKDYNQTIKDIVRVLKQDVSYRFLRFDGDEYTNIYQYKKSDNSLYMYGANIKALATHYQDIFDLINYRWGMMLENFNSSPRINKKVKIMDEREIKRSNLNKFHKFLDLENPHHHCFICNCEIDKKDLSVDHVIPWTYLYSDDLWNLVYVCRSCNSSKSNRIPNKKEIDKLKHRNEELLKKIEETHSHLKVYDELKLAINKDYVNKFWIGSKS